MKMKDRMERLIILPFSMACASEASVCAGNKSHVNKPPGISTKGGSSSSGLRMKKKNSIQLLARPKSNITRGLQRLINSLKNFSRLFVYRGDEIKEEGEAEVEMEIGFPTDVKHLTHIGWDGSTTVNNPVKGWENLSTSEIISFPSISLKQFEFAMASQAEQSKLPPLVSNKVV